MILGSLPKSACECTCLHGPRSVLKPGNSLMSGRVPAGVPYAVLRYDGGARYTTCGAFPCAGA